MEHNDGSLVARAAVLRQATGTVTVEDVALDNPGPFEVVIRVMASGLCHSDLHAIDGLVTKRLPLIVGHEAAGVIETVGDRVADLRPGDHVVTCVSQFCGQCAQCGVGNTWLCLNKPRLRNREPGLPARAVGSDGVEIDQFSGLGALSSLMVVHESGVVRIPDEIPFDRAALLGCSVLTGTGSVFRGAGVQAGTSVVVIGCGGVGLNVIQAARMVGAADIIAVDVHDSKLELARHFGATATVNSAETDAVEYIQRNFGGADYAFDAVGATATTVLAFRAVRAGRTAYVIGIPADNAVIPIPGPELLRDAKGLQGLLMGSSQFKRDIPKLASMYLRGQLDLDTLISERIGLDEVNEGFERMRKGVVARSVVVF
jgi:S-(hydroxymethyl)glutathione dehydrogenase/alcohol dehydrogenase